MFDNISSKIKTLAEITSIAGIVISILWGVILILQGKFLGGAVVGVLGALASWVGSFALYGFGQLIENSDIIADYCEWQYRQETKKDIEE